MIDQDRDEEWNYLIKDVQPYNQDNDIENMMKEFSDQVNMHIEPNRIHEVIGKLNEKDEKNIRRILYNIYSENKQIRKELNKQKEQQDQLKMKLKFTMQYFEQLFQCFEQSNDVSENAQEINQKYLILHNLIDKNDHFSSKSQNSQQSEEVESESKQEDSSIEHFRTPLKKKKHSSSSSESSDEEHHEETEFQKNQRKHFLHYSSNDEVELQSQIKADYSFQSPTKSYGHSTYQTSSPQIKLPQDTHQKQSLYKVMNIQQSGNQNGHNIQNSESIYSLQSSKKLIQN